MKVAVIPHYGGPEVFRIEERQEPEPGPGQMLVRVRASGVNFADLIARMGLYQDAPKPPMVLGYEVGGEVEKIGSGANGFKTGERVFGTVMFGGYAEKVLLESDLAQRLPEGWSFEQGAAVPVNYITAYHCLVYMGNLKPYETVLVHSAAGGVGTAATQIAKAIGATVIGTASRNKFDYLKEIGVDHMIAYREDDFTAEARRLTGGRGVDIVLDALGGRQLEKGYRALGQAGRLVTFGASVVVKSEHKNFLAAAWEILRLKKFNPMILMAANKAVIGVNINHLTRRMDIIKREMAGLMQLMEQHNIKPRVDRSFPLEQIADAHRYIHERKNRGKVVLTV